MLASGANVPSQRVWGAARLGLVSVGGEQAAVLGGGGVGGWILGSGLRSCALAFDLDLEAVQGQGSAFSWDVSWSDLWFANSPLVARSGGWRRLCLVVRAVGRPVGEICITATARGEDRAPEDSQNFQEELLLKPHHCPSA